MKDGPQGGEIVL